MKRMTVFVGIILFALGATLVLQNIAFAGTGAPSGNASGPPGLVISPNATGTKLYGTVAIEFYEIPPVLNVPHFSAKVFLRLRKGSTIEVFFGEILDLVATDIPTVQASLWNAINDEGVTLRQQILNAFFNGENRSVSVKSIGDYVQQDFFSSIDEPTCIAYGRSTCVITFVTTDIELAVN